MSEKRFVDNGCESIEDSGFEDALTGKNYYVDYFYEIVDLLNSLNDENEQLKEEIKAYPINEQYAKEIIEQNQKLRIERNDLRRENEQLRQQVQNAKEIAVKNDMQYQICRKEKEDFQDMCEQLKQEIRQYWKCRDKWKQEAKELKEINKDKEQDVLHLYKENEQLRKKLECCEYEHFLNELDEMHEKVDKGDLSDFSPLKEDKPLNDYNPLKERLYYWQCKYYRRDYGHKRDICTRCNYYGGLLNYCLKDKCDKMVKKDYEVTVTHFGDGVSIGWKKRVDKR